VPGLDDIYCFALSDLFLDVGVEEVGPTSESRKALA
jgi:hypothetical protein